MLFKGKFSNSYFDDYAKSKGRNADMIKFVDPDGGQMYEVETDGKAHKFGDDIEVSGLVVFADRNHVKIQRNSTATK